RLVELAQVDINASGECGSTPIHYCCMHDSVRCLETLIAHGADMYKANNRKTYPIHAALENVSRKCIEVLFAEEERKQRGNEQPTPKLLLVVNENEKPGRGSRRWSFRRSSISPSKEMPQMVTMVNHINLVDCEGDTPLHTAVRSGDLEQVKLNYAKKAEKRFTGISVILGIITSAYIKKPKWVVLIPLLKDEWHYNQFRARYSQS
ncbi:transient receptor potential cation channel subfamily A member 1, partial [Clonorchis sinensis]